MLFKDIKLGQIFKHKNDICMKLNNIEYNIVDLRDGRIYDMSDNEEVEEVDSICFRNGFIF